MKRIRLLVIMILLSLISTGCSVEYNININSSTIKEEIIVTDNITSKRTKEAILKHYNKWYPTYVNYIKEGEPIPLENFNDKVDGIEYHNKSINEINNGYKYNYLYTHDIDEYYDSYVIANTFADITVQNRHNVLVLKTSKENYLCNYDYFDSLIINITIDPEEYQINYNNADSTDNNTYTWKINRNNCKNSQIVLTLDKIQKEIDTTKNDKVINKNKDYAMYILSGILFIIILIGYFIYKKIKRKTEDFDIDD